MKLLDQIEALKFDRDRLPIDGVFTWSYMNVHIMTFSIQVALNAELRKCVS